MFLDITARKKVEKKLEDLVELKDRLLSLIAHDLRNPIISLISCLNIIKEDSLKLKPEELYGYMNIMKDTSEHMFSLLEDLLLWARTQQGDAEMNLEKITLRCLFANSLDYIKIGADAKCIRLENDAADGVFIYANHNMLNSVMRNLLGNAVKFSNPRTLVRVSAREGFDPALGKTVQIAVSDGGSGLRKERIDEILSGGGIYTTAGTAGEKGTGMGLLLCKEFIKRLGGSLRIESKEGFGSTFSFTLPNAPV